MTYQPKILAFAGSLRKDSYNKKLIKIAIKGAEDAGALVTYIDLKDYPMPLYDQEIEDSEGIPANALKIKELMNSHDGFLLSVPEYNSSLPAVFKNLIDWTSRKATPDEADLKCYQNKVVTLMSASPSILGGLRCLVHAKAIFGNINCIVLPQQKCIPKANQAFSADNDLKDASQQQDVLNLGKRLSNFLVKHHA